jgi:PTS hybrid protein
MVGLVVVSHSSRLAEGVVELAREMGGATVAIEAAGGLEAGGALGTSATVIAAAIERAWSEDGVLVVMDLGSAVLSAEAALELLDEGRGQRVVLSDAPLAEGAVIAAVAAGSGASLEAVAAEARRALEPKTKHLDRGAPEPKSEDAVPSSSLTEPFCLNGIPAAPGIAYGGVCRVGPGGLSGPGILLVRDLTPEVAALLDPSQVFGVACAAGSPASYGAGVARSKGIPAVTGLGDSVLSVPEEMELLIDGEAGLLYGEASREIGAAYRFRASALEDSARRARSRVAEPAVTRDGVRVEVRIPVPDQAGESAGESAAEEFTVLREAALDGEAVRLGAGVALPGTTPDAQAPPVGADSLSIDTDGLARHVLAAGPEDQADYLEPAVLGLIGRLVEAAEARGTRVGVHGRAGADPAALPLLVGLGVRQVTVLPEDVARVKESIRGLDAAEARSLAVSALGLDSAGEVRRVAAGFLGADAGARRPQMGTRQMPESDGVASAGSDNAGGTRR